MMIFAMSRAPRRETGWASGVLLVVVGLCASTDVQADDSTSAPAQFAICTTCHTTSADGANSMGPNLRGVVGRKAGTAPGFQYSSAMKSSGIRWTPQELDSYLTDVPKKVPGTLMSFPGLKDPKDRQAVIDYLRSLKK